MILVDTSLWIEFFRGSKAGISVQKWLDNGDVYIHNYVLGELLLGGLRSNHLVQLQKLPLAETLTDEIILRFIRENKIQTIGWVDSCLLASAMVESISIATIDKNLQTEAKKLGLSKNYASV